jgi:hypothetical protein
MLGRQRWKTREWQTARVETGVIGTNETNR